MPTPFPKPDPKPKKQPKPLKRTPLPPAKKPIKQVSDKRQAEMKAGLFKLQAGKPLKRITPKQARIEAEKSKVYRERSEGERPYCQGCGKYGVPLSNSHRIGQANKQHVCNPDNLDSYCLEGCHTNYESGRLYLLQNGGEVLDWLAQTDWERYRMKVFKMIDRIADDNLSLEDLPEFVEQHVFNVTK